MIGLAMVGGGLTAVFASRRSLWLKESRPWESQNG